MTKIKKIASVILALVLFGTFAATVYAAVNNEPFESENYYNSGGTKYGPFSLTYAGRGGAIWWDNCDWNDYVFRVNVRFSYPRDDWKMHSYAGTVYRQTPSGRVAYGHKLNTTNAHLCVGASEFDRNKYPYTFWTTSGVQNNVYVWIR